MIQANEMRLSNIVQPNYEHANQFHGYGRVTAIYHSEEKGERFTVDYHYPGSWFEPVKLSPSILEACGFEKGLYRGMDQWLGPWFERVQPLTRNRIGVIYNETIGYYYNASVVNVVLNSLHQLQNLYFALTGSELSINLEKVNA